MPSFATRPIDPVTGAIGRRASGAPLYRQGSVFGPPERCRMDRTQAWHIMAFAEALDRDTREPGKHGGVLKAKGLDVLRALLRRFYSYATGECFPSYDEIAEAAGCSRSTVAVKLRILEQLGIIDTIRRKVVASFISRARRVRFNVAVQTSNSYRFNLPIAEHGDTALPLLKPGRVDVLSRISAARKPKSKFWAETIKGLKSERDVDLATEKARWIAALLGPDESC